MSRIPYPRLAHLLALGAVLATGGCANEADPAKQSSAPQRLADSGADAASEDAPSCEPPAEPTATCKFASGVMRCPGRGGVTVECLGECPADVIADQGVRPGDCVNLCAADEYAAGCGGIGPLAPSAEPPSPDCPGMANPGGSAMYCCPCE